MTRLRSHTLFLTLVGLGAFVAACGADGVVPQVTENPSDTNVERVDLGGGCVRITRKLDPAWECSAEQLAIAEGSVAEPSPVSLSATDLSEVGCSGLVEMRREFLRSGNHGSVDAGYRTALQANCFGGESVTYEHNGRDVGYCAGEGYGSGVTATGGTSSWPGSVASGGSSSSNGGSSDGASEYSTTNNQVVGVEEADYVKNDAGRIFVLHDHTLRVYDAWPVESAHLLASVPFTDTPKRLLLDGDRLVVFLQTGGASASAECTYGYDCRAQAEPGGTEVRVFDVGNASAPKLVKTYSFQAGYVASRRIGHDVYVVTHLAGEPPPLFEGLTTEFEVHSAGEAEVLARSKHALVDAVAKNLSEEALLPKVLGEASGCKNALSIIGATGMELTALFSFNVEKLAPAHGTFVAAPIGFVYASSDALYMSVDIGGRSYFDAFSGSSGGSEASRIFKFALASGESAYRGSAEIRGHVLNQFAMDERDGVLRVATTAGWVPDPNVVSYMTTLTESGGALIKLGELGGIAPTEDIRSVRFDGDRAFVVTFKKTDPLFTIGLSDPAHPKVLGELKIPGFSTYMHPLDHDHLLALGLDADDQGSFAFFSGIQLQIFDVSDLSSPKLLHKTSLGTRGTSSEALTNHLAFTYFPAKKTLALPVTVCEAGGNGTYGTQMTFSGVIAYDVDLLTGITEKGRLRFAEPDASPLDYSGYGDCYTWWTHANSNVRRTMFLDDYLFGISSSEIRAAHLSNLSEPTAVLSLQ